MVTLQINTESKLVIYQFTCDMCHFKWEIPFMCKVPSSYLEEGISFNSLLTLDSPVSFCEHLREFVNRPSFKPIFNLAGGKY